MGGILYLPYKVRIYNPEDSTWQICKSHITFNPESSRKKNYAGNLVNIRFPQNAHAVKMSINVA